MANSKLGGLAVAVSSIVALAGCVNLSGRPRVDPFYHKRTGTSFIYVENKGHENVKIHAWDPEGVRRIEIYKDGELFRVDEEDFVKDYLGYVTVETRVPKGKFEIRVYDSQNNLTRKINKN